MVPMDQKLIVEHSRPEDQRPGTHLVVMLHGYGSHEGDLMGLLPALPEEGFTYASLRAPGAMPGGAGYEWFALTGLPERVGYSDEELRASTEAVIAWIEAERAGYSDVTLLGFSQGMAVATTAVRRRPDLARAVVGLSGFAAAPIEGFTDDAALTAREPRMPVFYGRDQADPVVPEEAVAHTLDWLRETCDVTKVLYAGMGHGVSNHEMKHVGEFLRHVLR